MLASVRSSKLGVAFALSCCRSSWQPVGSLGDESVCCCYCCCCCCCCSRGEDLWLKSVIAHVLVRLPRKCSQGKAELLSVAQHNLASRAAAGKSLPEDLQPMIYCRLEKQWQQSSGRGADNLASEFWVFLVKVTCWSSVLVTVVCVFVVLRCPSRHITPTSSHCHPANRWLVEKAFLWADLGNALHGCRVDRMITYSKTTWGLHLLLRVYGSAFPRSLIFSIISSSITVALYLTKERQLYDDWRHPYPYHIFAFIVGFIVVFRQEQTALAGHAFTHAISC